MSADLRQRDVLVRDEEIDEVVLQRRKAVNGADDVDPARGEPCGNGVEYFPEKNVLIRGGDEADAHGAGGRIGGWTVAPGSREAVRTGPRYPRQAHGHLHHHRLQL